MSRFRPRFESFVALILRLIQQSFSTSCLDILIQAMFSICLSLSYLCKLPNEIWTVTSSNNVTKGKVMIWLRLNGFDTLHS